MSILGGAAASAPAQHLSGFHKYPQFRTMSGLPGSSFPITPKGDVDAAGAISLSTPVAYSLGRSRFVVGAMTVSYDRSKFTLIDRKGDDLVSGNGTAQVLAGFGLGRYGNLTVAGLLLSGAGDTALNLHWAPPQRADRFTYAIGVQDVFGGGGASGVGLPGDGDSSTSLYAVVTGLVAKETYVSLGMGTRRFGRPFANVSTTLAPGLKGYAEYDAFNFNFGVGYFVPLGRSGDHRSSLTFNVGLVRAQYPSLSASIAF